MADVRHAGRTIVTDIEGGWEFSPGATGNGGQVIPFVRNNALKVRVLANRGCVHRLTVDYTGTQSNCRQFIDRVRDLYDYTVGTLSVDGFGSFSSCVLLGAPAFSPVKALASNRYMVTADLEIQQLI